MSETQLLHYDTMLTIAGSDSVGGAGIQADIKTATALGVYAMSAITAVTAQNTMRVLSYQAMSGKMIAAQIDAICADVTPQAMKTGMIPTAEAARAVVDAIRRHKLTNVVVDPVAVATSRDSLSDDSAISVIAKELFPLAHVITPNIDETALYSGMERDAVLSNTSAAAEKMLALGPQYVLIKGGDAGNDALVTDSLFRRDDNGRLIRTDFAHKRIFTPNTHGTGCSLSSAIASFLAKGLNLTEAVAEAEKWMSKAIEAGARYSFGHGHGPINHLFEILS